MYFLRNSTISSCKILLSYISIFLNFIIRTLSNAFDFFTSIFCLIYGILWVQIDGADVKKLRIKPSDQPHLSYSSEDFEKEETLTEIIDEILQNRV